jgi:DNA mismatch repair protein MutS
VLRQVALITLLAQVGSFVPADAARIGHRRPHLHPRGRPRRPGAGQSTFMVEMTEAADILNNATERSLVILDEIGAGRPPTTAFLSPGPWPSTWRSAGCKTLFATHYHC